MHAEIQEGGENTNVSAKKESGDGVQGCGTGGDDPNGEDTAITKANLESSSSSSSSSSKSSQKKATPLPPLPLLPPPHSHHRRKGGRSPP
eukprot:7384391-Ditylum_brightwellii.AAC.1